MEPDPPVSASTATLRFPCNLRWEVALGSPDPVFYGTLGGPKNGPQGSIRLARVTWGVRPGGSGHQNGRFVEAKRTFSQNGPLN